MTGDRPFRINPPRPSEAVAAQADRAASRPTARAADMEAADAAEAMTEAKARRRAATLGVMKMLELFERRDVADPAKLAKEIVREFDPIAAESLGMFSIRRLERAEKCFSAFVALVAAEME